MEKLLLFFKDNVKLFADDHHFWRTENLCHHEQVILFTSSHQFRRKLCLWTSWEMRTLHCIKLVNFSNAKWTHGLDGLYEMSPFDVSVAALQNPSSKVLLVLLCLKVVVRADFLHQPVISARESNEDAYNLEGFGTDPGCLGLCVLWVAGLPRIIHARLGLLGPVGSLIFNPAVEFSHHHHFLLMLLLIQWGGTSRMRWIKLGRRIWNQDWVFDVNTLSRWLKNLPSYGFGRRNDADGYVPQTGRVVPEVDTERAVDVVHNFPRHQEAELHCLHIEVKITPAQDLLGLWGCFCRGLGFLRRSVQILIQGLWEVLRPSIWTKWAVGWCFMFGGNYL